MKLFKTVLFGALAISLSGCGMTEAEYAQYQVNRAQEISLTCGIEAEAGYKYAIREGMSRECVDLLVRAEPQDENVHVFMGIKSTQLCYRRYDQYSEFQQFDQFKPEYIYLKDGVVTSISY